MERLDRDGLLRTPGTSVSRGKYFVPHKSPAMLQPSAQLLPLMLAAITTVSSSRRAVPIVRTLHLTGSSVNFGF